MTDPRTLYIGLMYTTALHGDKGDILESLEITRQQIRARLTAMSVQDAIYLLDANSAYANAVLAGKLPLRNHDRALWMARRYKEAAERRGSASVVRG